MNRMNIEEFLKKLEINPRMEMDEKSLKPIFIFADGDPEKALECFDESEKDEVIEIYNEEADLFFRDFIDPVLDELMYTAMNDALLVEVNERMQVSLSQITEKETIESFLARAMMENEEHGL